MSSKKIKSKCGGKRVKVETGFPELDRMLQGGLPPKTITLLSGACGTGKSTLAMGYLYHGASVCNEPGVYVTLEETPESIITNMSQFGWNLAELVEKKKLVVIKPQAYRFETIRQVIADAIDSISAKRLVVDSYSVLLTYFSDPDQIRNGLVQLDREIKKMGCTALVISDIKDNAEIFSTTGVEEFIVDGVIVLSLIKDPEHPFSSRRAISIRKMRATKHPLSLHHFDITERGIQVGEALDSSTWRKGRTGPKRAHARRPRRGRARKKKAEAQPPKPLTSRIDISTLRRRGAHTWRWKHL